MKTFKGTPGKWQQSHRIVDEEGNYSTEVYDSKGKTICTLAWYPIRKGNMTFTAREDNAKLIAAAPDLLEALMSCIMSMQVHPDCEPDSEFEGFVEKGWEAINKALGE